MIGLTLLLTRKRKSLISVRCTTLVDGEDFNYIPHLTAVGTRHIVSQLYVYRRQIMIMENFWWGGGNFTMKDGRGYSRVLLVWTQVRIGRTSMKIT